MDGPAHGERAGEADTGHVRMRDECLACRRVALDEVEHAVREARPLCRVDEQGRGQGGERGRFEDRGAAGEQGRGDLPDRDGEREVPGRDESDDADGAAEGVGEGAVLLGGRGDPAEEPGLSRGEVEYGAGSGHLAARLAQQLALLPGDRRGELRFPFGELPADRGQVRGPLDRSACPPGGQGRRGGVHRPVGVHAAGLGELPHVVAQIGRVDIGPGLSGLGRAPAAVDEVQQMMRRHRLPLRNVGHVLPLRRTSRSRPGSPSRRPHTIHGLRMRAIAGDYRLRRRLRGRSTEPYQDITAPRLLSPSTAFRARPATVTSGPGTGRATRHGPAKKPPWPSETPPPRPRPRPRGPPYGYDRAAGTPANAPPYGSGCHDPSRSRPTLTAHLKGALMPRPVPFRRQHAAPSTRGSPGDRKLPPGGGFGL